MMTGFLPALPYLFSIRAVHRDWHGCYDGGIGCNSSSYYHFAITVLLSGEITSKVFSTVG